MRKAAAKKERDVLIDHLKAHGMRVTAQRGVILDHFLNLEKHQSPDDIFGHIRRHCPTIGRATVYRTLKLLSDANIADAVEFGDRTRRFEPKHNQAHHDHLVCTRCGRSFEFVNDTIEDLQQRVAKKHGFVMQRHRLEIFGLCRECAGKQAPRR